MQKQINTIFYKNKTISALRVLDKLEKISCPCLKSYTVFKKKCSYRNRFFIVNNNWKQELDVNKKVTVIAEITSML
tara:strand:- start:3363 stop:3590 length:228 start_codon:yes stop_codon:yes gene_type:complete